MSDETTMIEEYRIVSRAPGETNWWFRYFTGSSGTNLATVEARVATAEEESPGWQFRIEHRTRRVTVTPWSPAEPR